MQILVCDSQPWGPQRLRKVKEGALPSCQHIAPCKLTPVPKPGFVFSGYNSHVHIYMCLMSETEKKKRERKTMVQLLCHQLLCFKFSLLKKKERETYLVVINSTNQVNYSSKLVET